jgi:hypothetical protein
MTFEVSFGIFLGKGLKVIFFALTFLHQLASNVLLSLEFGGTLLHFHFCALVTYWNL